MSKWTPGPLRYEAGVLYVDRGIQPHVARITDGLPDADKWGALLAEAPAMAELLEALMFAHELPGEHCEVEQVVMRARALLARVKGEG